MIETSTPPASTLGPLPTMKRKSDCLDERLFHEWRIIENFHEELPRDLSKPRVYAAYCIYCLLSKGVEVKIK